MKIRTYKPQPSPWPYAIKAGNYLMTHRQLTLVHGSSWGLPYAWLEKGRKVIDPTQGIEMSKKDYYRLMGIDTGLTMKFTYEQARKHMARTQRWFNWY